MKDYRNELLNKLSLVLIENVETEKINDIINRMLIILNDYEITNRSTELMIVDTPNVSLLKQYSASLLIEGKSKLTAKNYIRTCNKLAEFMNKSFLDAKSYDIKTFLAFEKQRGISNVTLRNTRMYLSAFFGWLEREEIIDKNPCKSVKTIKCEEMVKLPFSTVEMDMLKKYCTNDKTRAIVEMLISSGVRVSELTNAKLSDINFDTLTFHVKHGKGNKERITYFTEVASMYLKRYLLSRNDNIDMLFVNRLGMQYSTNGIRDMLNKIAQRANVENVHPHRFRRTFATELAKKGMDIQEIKKLMGHSDINTTLKYVYTNNAMAEASYRKYVS